MKETRNTLNRARAHTRYIAALALALALSAWGASAEDAGWKQETSLSFLATTKLELKSSFRHSVKIPALTGDSALTAGNGFKLTGGADVSPVSVNAVCEVRFTPIAFLEFVAGGSVGSGWNIPIADGLRKNERGSGYESNLTGGAFDGLVVSAKGGALFQFDLAAIFPGEWNHVVFQTYHAAQYRALTSASGGESWLYEADAGENRNGWLYYGNYFVGYKMPKAVSLVGLLVEEELYLYDVAGGEAWGDDISRWVFGPLVNATFSDTLQGSLLVQARTMRNFTDETKDRGFYQDRRVQGGDERRIEFYRVVASIKMIL